LANFVQVGKHHINLEQVSCVTETREGVRVFYPHGVGDGYAYDDLRGDAAKLMLAFIHTDDDEIERLSPLVNAPQLTM